MFDREKEIITKNICDSIFSDRDEILLKKIINLPIPNSIIKFFVEEIELKFELELREIKKNTSFNFDLPEAQPYFNSAFVLLRMNKPIRYNDFRNTFLKAIDFNLEFLLRPHNTITDFIYDIYDKISIPAIERKLRFIVEYDYLIELIKSYFERVKSDYISRQDFLILLRAMDKEYCKNFTLVEHYRSFVAFKEFLRKFKFDIDARPEAEAFQVFLNDKEEFELAAIIDKTKTLLTAASIDFEKYLFTAGDSLNKSIKLSSIDPDVKTEILKTSVEELMKDDTVEEPPPSIITAPLTEKQPTFAEQITEELKTDETSDFLSKFADYNKGTSANETEQEDDEDDKSGNSFLSIFKKKVKEQELKEEPENKKEEPVKPSAPIPKETTVAQPPKKIFDDSYTAPGRNLDEIISSRLKRKVIKKLLDGDETDYYKLIENLSNAKDWDHAVIFLTESFEKHNIDPYNSISLKFTEFLYDNIK